MIINQCLKKFKEKENFTHCYWCTYENFVDYGLLTCSLDGASRLSCVFSKMTEVKEVKPETDKNEVQETKNE